MDKGDTEQRGTAAEQRKGYAKGQARRQAIVDEALELFSRTGYRNSSMREIARRVGLTQSGLMHHFADKEELFAEVLHQRDETVRGAAGEPAEHTLIDQAGKVVAHNQSSRGLASLYAIVSAEASDPDHPLHDEFVDRYRSAADRAGDLLRRAQEAGEVRTDLDPDLAGRLISAVMDGIQLQWLLDESVDMVPLFEEFVRGYFLPSDAPEESPPAEA
ncbi:TetR/AcrR family transcriptional regulator [Microbacterium oxydans]|uniref:TetR/AcrR family transcriptional regulator n=1 Tax=Microbacterium oxydans TaxID=82380 RepID=UPI0022B19C32|nr:TetR/AcrR family transcriptional regulator [Microbacterium oxydans]MCZ4302215.1 TetR/AcrR family transcriptional regulator [Microbacterium oxydans]